MTLGGYPWEQGRWSLYASMLGIMLVVALSWREIYSSLRGVRRRGNPSDPSDFGERERCDVERVRLPCISGLTLFIGCVLFAIFFLFPTLSCIATLQGTIQILFLSVFAWLVYKNERLRTHLPFWIMMSLVPVVFLACWEFFAQTVPAIKWLGLAAQNPAMRGPSVIELADGTRVLRAYGSFSHPNVLGGWLAFAMLLQVRSIVLRAGSLWGLVLLPFFFIALAFSFSRSAWLALFMGLLVMAWTARRDAAIRRRMGVVGAILVACTALFVFLNPTLVYTRVANKDRLETRSINERTASLAQGWEVVRAFPFGTGFEAYRVGLDRICGQKPCVAPLEPPHFVPLLMLAELGWVRLIGLVSFMVWIIARFCKQIRIIPWELVACLTILAGLDHYLWSSWAGQGVFIFVMLIWFVPGKEVVIQ